MQNAVAARWMAFIFIATIGAFGPRANAGDVTVRDDQFLPYREFVVGAPVTNIGTNKLKFELIARSNRKSHAVTTLVHVEIAYIAEHRRSYESARNARAESHEFTIITRTKSCEKRDFCVHDDTFSVAIPFADLTRSPPEGYAFKVFGRGGGDTAITVPKSAIDRLLTAAGGRTPVQSP